MSILPIFLSFFLLIAAVIYVSTLVAFFITKVPFIKSPKRVQEKMLELAKIRPGDIVYDLGCGSARLLILANKKYKAQTVGFEISPWPYLLAKLNIFLKNSKAKVLFKNFFEVDLSEADVILCYLMPNINERLRPKLERELKSGTRIVSYAFSFQGWKAREIIPKNPETRTAQIFFYQWPEARMV